MKKWNVAAIMVASVCVGTGCKTGNAHKSPDVSVAQAPRKLEIVEPEGVNLSDVVAFHGLDEFKPSYYYSTDMPAEAMRLYRHRFVELDGEAPAEVILTMVRKSDLEMLEQVDELPHYTSVMHHVYTFKKNKNGDYLGSFESDMMNPYSTLALKIEPLELHGDGRQELLLTDDTAYYLPLQLFELKPGTDRIQDVIWSEPQAKSFVPYDHDGDGTLELMALPASEVISGLFSWQGDDTPTKPFIVARDGQGFWHVQPLKRPFESWAAPMLMSYLDSTSALSYTMLESLKAYSTSVEYTFPAQVYERLLGLYEGLDDPFERARMVMSMPVERAQVVHRLCSSALASTDALEMHAACFAALSDAPDQANRELILEYYGEFQRKMSEYPQLNQGYYQVPKLSSLSMWVSRAFEAQQDDRFLQGVFDRALEDVNDQTFYMRTGELYSLMQWGYEEELEAHRFVLDLFFERLRETIKKNQGYEARVLFEPLQSTALGSLVWYHQELERKNKGEEVDEEMLARGAKTDALRKKELPAQLFEPLIGSADPQLRILAIHYFASTDTARYAEIFRTRVSVEKEDAVRQELFSRLHMLSQDTTLSKAFWKAEILSALRSSTPQASYTASSMIPYFMNKATPAEIAELWDESNSQEFQQQILWQLPMQGAEELSGAKWAPIRERVVAFYKQSTNSSYRSSMMYLLPNMKSEEVAQLLRDSATQEQDVYVVQAALQSLITMKDEQALTLLKLREDEMREQSYVYASLLQAVAQFMPEQATPLLIKELERQDPTQPLESQLLWTVGGMMYGEENKRIPVDIVNWLKRDTDAGLAVETTSCVRLGQQVMILFLAGEKDWEKRLQLVEAHPDCKSASTPYVARKFAVDAAISMSYQPTQQQHDKLFSFIRQHHDFPYRPIRVAVAQFENRLKAMAEEKAKLEQQKTRPKVP